MKQLQLTQGKVVMLDDEDFALVSKYSWCVSRKAYNNYAVVRREGNKIIYLHRLLMNTPQDQVVDHIDGNDLNCQRSNMRNCTRAQNAQNQKTRAGYKGVSWDSINKKYKSYIKVKGRQLFLGRFVKASDAAKVYNDAALYHFKAFASLNVLEEEV